MKFTALQDTYLKKSWDKQAKALTDDDRHFVPKGKAIAAESYDEFEDDDDDDAIAHSDQNGHIFVTLAHGQGEWYLFAEHFQFESQVIIQAPSKLPEWNDVNWIDFAAPVSQFFTVGEVTNMSRERIPREVTVQKNIIAIARRMDEIREWWGGPLGVNSWYRPWPVNRRIGSRAPNHPNGYGVDIRPLNGSVWDLEKRFEQEWYNAGKWNGGFGKGARRGFIHLDLRSKRVWDY